MILLILTTLLFLALIATPFIPLPNNKLIILGGNRNTTEVYDPSTSSMSSNLPSMTTEPIRNALAALSF